MDWASLFIVFKYCQWASQIANLLAEKTNIACLGHLWKSEAGQSSAPSSLKWLCHLASEGKLHKTQWWRDCQHSRGRHSWLGTCRSCWRLVHLSTPSGLPSLQLPPPAPPPPKFTSQSGFLFDTPPEPLGHEGKLGNSDLTCLPNFDPHN